MDSHTEQPNKSNYCDMSCLYGICCCIDDCNSTIGHIVHILCCCPCLTVHCIFGSLPYECSMCCDCIDTDKTLEWKNDTWRCYQSVMLCLIPCWIPKKTCDTLVELGYNI